MKSRTGGRYNDQRLIDIGDSRADQLIFARLYGFDPAAAGIFLRENDPNIVSDQRLDFLPPETAARPALDHALYSVMDVVKTAYAPYDFPFDHLFQPRFLTPWQRQTCLYPGSPG